MRYISALCEGLASRGYDLSLFFEVKANLSTKALGQLRDAGVRMIQPGIESLSSNVLKIMEKGTDMLTNVRLLKGARQHGISVAWNLLTGFPGETEADHLDQASLIPLLHHLEPPVGVGDLRLDRFSPYFDRPPESFRDIRPFRAYSFIYPSGRLDLSKVAYFFEYTPADRVPEAARDALRAAVACWRERWRAASVTPTLCYERGPGWIRILDTRGTGPRDWLYDGWRATAYLGCGDSARTAAALTRQLRTDLAHPPPEPEVEAFLQECVDRRLAVTERGRYLALALPTPW